MTREEVIQVLTANVMVAVDRAEFGDACSKMVEDALNIAIEALKDRPTEWIPVSERLPKEYGEYICTMSNGYVQECGFVPSGEKGLVTGWSTCEADGFKKLDYQDVIAWMPLPEPYKAESEEI